MVYREFYIRGVGREMTVDSNRNRPCYMLSAPLAIKKVNVKTVEMPLTFNPTVYNQELPYRVIYTFDDGTIYTFTESVDISGGQVLSGNVIAESITDAGDAHNNGDGTALLAGGNLVISGTAPDPTNQINGVPLTCAITNTGTFKGRPDFQVGIATAAGGATNLTSCVVDFIQGSLLATFMDFLPYSQTASVTIDTPNGAGTEFVNDLLSTPAVRTRPSYFLLHSNLRTGFVYHSTAVPAETSGTVLAKISVPMSDDVELGAAAIVWDNPTQHPDLFFSTDEADYSKLEFWMTYPDGVTLVDFGGNYFSLTLSTIVHA